MLPNFLILFLGSQDFLSCRSAFKNFLSLHKKYIFLAIFNPAMIICYHILQFVVKSYQKTGIKLLDSKKLLYYCYYEYYHCNMLPYLVCGLWGIYDGHIVIFVFKSFYLNADNCNTIHSSRWKNVKVLLYIQILYIVRSTFLTGIVVPPICVPD